MIFENTLEFAKELDEKDELKSFQGLFEFPLLNENKAIYLCGNSLGLKPKNAQKYINEEFDDWSKYGVEAHFEGRRPWLYYHKFLQEKLSNLVGAKKDEVVAMNQLSVNIHILFETFYKPQGKRKKIVMEAGAFPSDMYAVQSQIERHGLNYDDCVIEISPNTNEHTLSIAEIEKVIQENADEIALVFFSGVQYYTGQTFDIQKITELAHAAGAVAGFDLAHAAGNIYLDLHNWNVDFATWCSYKYLNSGPGNISGVFIHEKYSNDITLKRLSGWWGYNEKDRFKMQRGYIAEPGAAGWQLSNANVFGSAIHLASLDIFEEAGMENLCRKSLMLTAYFRYVILDAKQKNQALQFEIITPENQAGCQLSLLTNDTGKQLFTHLHNNSIIADWREPNVIRMAPVPLYNSFEDAWKVGNAFLKF